MNATPGNSRESWDQRYRRGDHWDTINGDEMTRRFAELIADAVPNLGLGRTILDWGCGRGEGVQVYRERWPDVEVTGMDFSSEAIMTALDRVGPPFYIGEEIEVTWDAIVCSNVMEHVLAPVWLLQKHLAMTNDLYVILTPYLEDLGPDADVMTPEERSAAGHVHVQKFDFNSFPLETHDTDGRLWRVTKEDLVVPGPVWPGRQMLVVYER